MLGQTNSMTGPYGAGDPSSDLSIAVTHPAGAVCTCTNGTRTLRSVDEIGQCIFFLPESGEWVVNFTDDQDSRNQVVDISGDNTTEDVELDYSITRKYLSDSLEYIDDDNITSIGNYAFYSRTRLLEVNTPNATVVGEFAFYNCTSLKEFDFSSIQRIGGSAFGYTGFRTIRIPNAVAIGGYAFGYCSNLELVDLESSDASSIQTSAFANCTKLRSVFIRSETISSSSGPQVFDATHISYGDGGIYVPESLVDSYKIATNWATYANNIFPIDSYPVTDFETISDSWETIFANELNGTYSTKYTVGDVKSIEYNGIRTYAQIIAIDGDDLADNTGKAPITWLLKPIVEKRKMNSTRSNVDGWAQCELRSYMRSTCLQYLPQIIRNNIKEVTKTYYDAANGTLSIADTVWIPSYHEITGNTSTAETSGVVYNYLSDIGHRIKYTIDGIASDYYWLRSASSGSTQYRVITGNAANTVSNADSTYGVTIGFCT